MKNNTTGKDQENLQLSAPLKPFPPENHWLELVRTFENRWGAGGGGRPKFGGARDFKASLKVTAREHHNTPKTNQGT